MSNAMMNKSILLNGDFLIDFSKEKRRQNTKICVYRLLRPDENPKNGLFAKDSSSSVSIDTHITNGSHGTKSKYISCCRTLAAVKKFARKSGNRICRIAKIKIKRKSIIDLTEEECLCTYVHNEKGRNFAECFKEVLIEDYIPPECITDVFVLP